VKVRWIDQGEPIGTRRVFATRTCCGPDGEGPCKSAAEGLPCGVADVPMFAPIPMELVQRGQQLRQRRLALGLSLREMAARMDCRASEWSALENGG
jgi:hypothetical protein